MEQAIALRDRTYFNSAVKRMESFLESWGFRSPQAPALKKYPMCIDAVTDYLIVGLCKISPPGSICEPATFFPKFEANLQGCRDATRANPSLNADVPHAGLRPGMRPPVSLVR